MRKPSSFAALREDRRRGGKIGRSAYKFVAVVGISLVLAVCLHFGLLGTHSGADAWNQRRDLATLATDDDTCRMVHSAPDQCKWIKKHCPQDDGAYSAYLDLYFCQLPRLKPLVFILLASWLGLLFSTIGIAASDFFCVDLSTMAKILGMSESMAGVTLLAFGNGSPDVFSTFAAMSSDSGDLAVGELMGAAGFITAVVAGAMAIIRPFKVSKKSFVRDVIFFAVAAAFTMVILSDGILHLWECLAMIGYYVFYVIFVITWHWFESRRKRKLDTEAAARGHYAPVLPGEEPYRDDPDDTSIRPSTLRAPSHDDFAALERSTVDDDGDYSDEERDRWMSELNTNMRVSRPLARPRSTTIAPVRPSLVGALEFQAVLKSLQKSRNQQSVPLNTRRYSDDPNLRAFDIPPQQTRRVSIGPGSPEADRSPLGLLIPPLSVGGPQAYTATEAPRKTLDDELQWRGQGHPPHHVSFQPPTIEVSVYSPEQDPADRPSDLSALRAHPVGSKSDNLLNHRKLLNRLNSPTLSPREPTLAHHVLLPSPPRSRSRSSTRSHTPPSPFPAYRDESLSRIDHLALPPPIVEPEPDTLTLIHGSEYESQFATSRQWRWWPYSILPSPESMACVLFPTLTDFRAKGIWAKTLSVIAAPSVFLLTITLPVVESDSPEEELVASRSASVFQEPPKKPTDPVASQEQTDGSTAAVMTAVEQHLLNKRPDSVSSPSNVDSIDDMQARLMQQSAIHEAWPRWLLLIQLYTAPWTVLLSAWSQAPETLPPSWLIKPGLIALLISTLSLIVVLLTTTSSYRPRQYRWILALVGFAVSIAWISTIANQVVDALKALAVILNWSNAIMGLTVFAVGNSVGDLVADVTVANLGYPVMALSACFGGPMLNILLGIGLSGTYTILQGADKRSHKHPKKGFVIKDYHLDVGKTLIISGAALLVTLIGVLIAVPLSKWTMTRKIGIALIVVWLLSTIGNVVVEVTGIADVKRYP